MASKGLLESPQDEKKRKLQESSLLSMDIDMDPAAKRPCLAAGSDSQVPYQNSNQWDCLTLPDWEDVHRQADEGESLEAGQERVKRIDKGFHLPKPLQRAGSEPAFGRRPGALRLSPKPTTETVKVSPAFNFSSKPFAHTGKESLTSSKAGLLYQSPPSPESNSSARSKRSFEEDGTTASGAGVSGVSHEGPPDGRRTASTPWLPLQKHRKIMEEGSSGSEDEAEQDGERAGGSAVVTGSGKGGAFLSRKDGGTRSIDSGRPPQSSVESASLLEGGLFGGGRRQVFPPLPGMMKRSTSRVDLTEEKRPAVPLGGGVPLFQRLTRGLPPESGESVGSEKSDGTRARKDQDDLRRKELESLPSALRTSLFPLRADSGLSGLGTSDRRVVNSNPLSGAEVDKPQKQSSGGVGFKLRPPTSLGVGGGGGQSTGVDGPHAAKFVLPNGVRMKKAASDTVVPGPTLTDEVMRERTLHSVSITSAQGRKQTVEDEFEAYFAQMGISM